MKKGLLVLTALYTGFAVYCVLIFFYGKSGYFELKSLIRYRDSLVENNQELQEAGNALSREAQKLLSDSDILRLKARELGYLKKNQGKIIFSGYMPKEQTYSLGRVLKWQEHRKDHTLLFRSLAVGLSILMLLLSIVFGKKQKIQRNGKQPKPSLFDR